MMIRCANTLIFWCCLQAAGFTQPIRDPFLVDAPVMTFEQVLIMGLERNLDVRLDKLQIPVEQQDVEYYEAEFDPTLESSLDASERKIPSSSSLTSGGHNITRERAGEIGIRKRFRTGLESRLSLNTARTTDNSRVNGLSPQYRTQMVLNLIQPVLRDFGTEVNQVNIRLSENEVQQAASIYQERALEIAEELELTYYDLAEAIAAYQFRQESLELAGQLLEANRQKFDAGLSPINEVQEAETALASRREQIILAKQEVETTLNRLRDLLELTPDHPLFTQPFLTEPVLELTEPDLRSPENSLLLAHENRPDFRRAQAEIERWNIQLRYYENQKLPRLDLQATLGLNGLSGKSRAIPDLGDDFVPTNPHVGDYFESYGHLVEGEGLEWFIGFQLSYPLGNRAADARYRQSSLQKYQSILELKQLENLIETEVTNAMTVIQRSWERVQVAQEFQQLAEQSLDQENERFRLGISDTFRLLDFQDDVIDARIRKTNALVDYHQGLANYYRALGTNLERFAIHFTTNSEIPPLKETKDEF